MFLTLLNKCYLCDVKFEVCKYKGVREKVMKGGSLSVGRNYIVIM